jgi:3-deoxy-D-manno-octulosonate 8-phosphate phosphatase (KDO 8-P phosphatase)
MTRLEQQAWVVLPPEVLTMAERNRRALPESVALASGTLPSAVARRIALVVFDVDGVLTDAGVLMNGKGNAGEVKRFDVQDGLGLKLLRDAGVQVAIVSGRVSPATAARAQELGVVECHQENGAQKLPVVDELRTRMGLEWSEVAMLADDLPDAAVLTRVGLPAAVANAVPLIRDCALWVSTRSGGHGAVREFCDALLEARGDLMRVSQAYVDERGGVGQGPAGLRWREQHHTDAFE